MLRSALLSASRSSAGLARRALSTGGRPTITLEQALTSNHLIIGELESAAAQQQLSGVQAQTDLLAKWQHTNAVLVHATLRVLPQVGFSPDGPGLQGYTEAVGERTRTEAPEAQTTLRELNDSKWKILLKTAFGCEPAAPLALSQVRELAIAMVDALQDPALLRQVEEARSGLAARLSEQERQTMVARAMVSVQAEVCAKHGFAGDEGYAQAQVCIMEHATDAVVTGSIAAATTNFYARAGINLQQALHEAASATTKVQQ